MPFVESAVGVDGLPGRFDRNGLGLNHIYGSLGEFRAQFLLQESVEP